MFIVGIYKQIITDIDIDHIDKFRMCVKFSNKKKVNHKRLIYLKLFAMVRDIKKRNRPEKKSHRKFYLWLK